MNTFAASVDCINLVTACLRLTHAVNFRFRSTNKINFSISINNLKLILGVILTFKIFICNQFLTLTDTEIRTNDQFEGNLGNKLYDL